MKKAQQQITDFMLRAEQDCPERPILPSIEVMSLRVNLIGEELGELCAAFNQRDLIQTYDAILDLLVVTIGTAVACGLEIEPGWEEVHRSNMTKFIDGHRRPDGKWIKGPSYSPANLKPIIDAQLQ